MSGEKGKDSRNSNLKENKLEAQLLEVRAFVYSNICNVSSQPMHE
jgi:hypothetical protein